MTAAFWDKRSATYDEKVSVHDAQYDKTIENTKSLLNKSDVVLDFACASGEMSLDLAPQVQRIHGIDISLKMIELARQKAHDRQVGNVRFDQTDAFDQSLANHSFSAILAFNIFHLLNDTPRTLCRLYDLLAPGGLLISQTPCLGEWRWILRSLIGLAQKTGLAPPILNITIPELESLVSGGNFKILKTTIWDQKNKVQWIVARKAQL